MRAQRYGGDDPIIPFRVSHANAIAENASTNRILLAVNGGEMVLLAALLTFLLMKGGG
jgi:hypothetical protein